MTKAELLDHFALNALNSLIQKHGLANSALWMSENSYRMAENMIEYRQKVLDEWALKEDMANGDIFKMDLPMRVFYCLRAEGIYKTDQLREITRRDMLRIPNMGKKGLQQLIDALPNDFKFKGDM